jgi:hypothetical protein
MKYSDGRVSKLGDIVSLGGKPGKVVSDIDGGDYGNEPAHSSEQWAYLGTGVMIEFGCCGLIHYTEPENDLVLVSRGESG